MGIQTHHQVAQDFLKKYNRAMTYQEAVEEADLTDITDPNVIMKIFTDSIRLDEANRMLKKINVFLDPDYRPHRVCFKIGVQTFHVCEREEIVEAEWYEKQLNTAFNNLRYNF